MLEVKNLSCGYGAFEAVHGISLSLQPGTITGLLGANGAGKSSTLMCLAGHVTLNSGQILFNQEDISRLPPYERVRKGLAISPEGRRLRRRQPASGRANATKRQIHKRSRLCP